MQRPTERICRLIRAFVAFGFAAGVLRAAVGLSISPSIIHNDFTGKVSLTITGLDTGQTVRVEKFADINTNGSIDTGTDVLVRSFVVTDGAVPSVGGHRNVNLPGDDDGATDGQIRVDLDQPGLDDVFGAFTGNFLYRVSNVTGTSFTVLNTFAVLAQPYTDGITGHVTRATDHSPVAGACVKLMSLRGNSLGGMFSDATGFYHLQPPAGDYFVVATGNGLITGGSLWSVSTGPNVTATADFPLTAGTTTLTGQLKDDTSYAGIPGVFVSAYSDGGEIVGGFTDANGNYSLSVSPGHWTLDFNKNELAQLGYLSRQAAQTADISTGSAVVNLALAKFTGLIYGTVKDNLGNPVAGVSLVARDLSSEAVGASSATDGAFALGVRGGDSWSAGVDADSAPPGYIAAPAQLVPLNPASAVESDVVLQRVTAHLQGTLTNAGIPMADLQIEAHQGSGSNSLSVSTLTDDNGNFDLGVVAGDWIVVLNSDEAVAFGFVCPSLPFAVNDGQTIAGIAYHALTSTGTLESLVFDPNGMPVLGGYSIRGTATIAGLVYNAGADFDSRQYSFPVVDGLWTVSLYSDLGGMLIDQQQVNVVGSATANFPSPRIGLEPQNQQMRIGGQSTFSAQFHGGNFQSSQWQVSTDGGATWNNLTNDATYSGATGSQLTINPVTNAMNGWLFRSIGTFNNGAVSVTSDSATLQIVNAAADFNNDGNSDLVWQNQSTGERSIWLMNGATFESAVNLGTISTDWSIAATGDFDGDGNCDLYWENRITGERLVWLMSGTSYSRTVSLGTISAAWSIAGTGDFNGDGKTDIIWENLETGERLIWLMNDATYTGSISLGVIPAAWSISGVSDFDGDGKPDIVWENAATGECVIWIMNGTAYSSAVELATVAPQSRIAGIGDYNSDGRPDILWTDRLTGDRTAWLMNSTFHFDTVAVTTLPPEWAINRPFRRAAPVDMDGDGHSDLIWQNSSTGDRLVWLMSGTTYLSSASLGNIPIVWSIAGSGDFNNDGSTDLLWQNSSTGERVIWLMNGTNYASAVSLGTISTDWSIAGTGDFNADGNVDILWQNSSTGERIIWLMNGTNYASAVSLGSIASAWSIVGTGDFNADGNTDILWQNTSTGECVIWLMNGTSYASAVALGTITTDWSIAGTGDFNNDGSTDIVWQNSPTGECVAWLMTGTAFSSGVSLGTAPAAWSIRN